TKFSGTRKMEMERELGRVSGLGRGMILGFTLIVTDQKLQGIDTRKASKRILLTMMLGLGFGMVLTLSLVYFFIFSGLERAFARINPVLDFVSIFALLFALPIGVMTLLPKLLRRRLSGTGYSTITAPRRDIIAIESEKPGRTTQKGYFTVRLMNGDSF